MPPCAWAVPALLEMLRERPRITLPPRLQPLAREPMPERPIPLGQHCIRALPQKRVPKGELLRARKTALRAPQQDLPLHQGIEPRGDPAPARLAAEERRDPRGPAYLAEYTR